MAWQNNNESGGPWGGSGGSGEGSGGGGGPTPPKSPWGEGPPRRPTPQRGPTGRGPLDDFIRRGQDRLRGSMPGGGGQFAQLPWLPIAAVILGVWLFFTATYRVQAQERGVVLR